MSSFSINAFAAAKGLIKVRPLCSLQKGQDPECARWICDYEKIMKKGRE
jgi:hypothetical protein